MTKLHKQRCETCEYIDKERYRYYYCKFAKQMLEGEDLAFIEKIGCYSHSSVMDEKNKVLDMFLKEMRGEMTAPFEYLDWDSIEAAYIRLRSKRDGKL